MFNDYKGLSSSNINELLKKYGYNEIVESKNSIIKIITNQVKSPLVYLLILSAIISFSTNDVSGGIVITIIVLINTLLGFVQEYRSNKIFEKLKNFISSNVKVYRDNKWITISKTNLVPGDLLEFQLGDVVGADCLIISQENLEIDESSLTGESVSVAKEISDLTKFYSIDDIRLFGQNNDNNKYLLLSGSSIKKGSVKAIVYATSLDSRFGKISDLSVNTKKKSEFEENIASLSKVFTIVSLISLFCVIALHLIFNKESSPVQLLLFTLAIAITIIPEALPVVANLSLAKSASKLSKMKVVVKKTSAIEDLGNIDIICTDKTGTLTKNTLDIQKVSSIDKNNLYYYSYLLSAESTEPIDEAILKYSSSQLNNKPDLDKYNDIPFDPDLRYSAREFKDCIIYKGSPENIVSKFCESDKCSVILDEINNMSSQGLRIISVAVEMKSVESKNVYLGTYYFSDEIKEDAKEAILLAEKHNLQIKIITGDSLDVAIKVGKEVDLIKENNDAILAKDLSFSDPNKLFEEVSKYKIFARTSPVQKYNIIQSLESKYHVGYLGDGINDAPSLKIANVGMVVDSASDIAKSNADIILLTKNLKVIILGINEGRKVFVNIDKYLKHTISSNFGNLYTVGLVSLFLNFLPMLPIQILINNLLCDIPCLAMATDNVESYELRKPKHHTNNNLIEFSIIMGIVASISDVIFFIIFSNNLPQYIQGLAFVFSTLAELLVMFLIRTRKFIFKAGKPSKLLFIISFISFFITLLLAMFGAEFINLLPVKPQDFLLVTILIIGYLVVSEIVKILYYKFASKKD